MAEIISMVGIISVAVHSYVSGRDLSFQLVVVFVQSGSFIAKA